MKSRQSILACLVAMAMWAFALSLCADQPPTFERDWIIKAQGIPTSAMDIGALVSDGNPTGAQNLSVCQLDLSIAPGTSSVNVTIRDNQATPAYFLNAVPITPTGASQGTTWVGLIRASNPLGCKVFWGGMTIQASATGVTIAASGRW